MGSEDGGRDKEKHETPIHRVWLDSYYMDKYEVTKGEYKRFIDATGHRAPPKWVSKYAPHDNHAMVGAYWADASAYCTWAGKQLPTEAQWEKAARGEKGPRYPWGNNAIAIERRFVWGIKLLPILSLKEKARANYCDFNCDTSWRDLGVDDGFRYTAPVGSYESGKSTYGIYDLAGNVWEWVRDWYDPSFYTKSPVRNPVNKNKKLSHPIRGKKGEMVHQGVRIIRGGGWRDDRSVLRAAYRRAIIPAYQELYLNRIGFRCVIELPETL